MNGQNQPIYIGKNKDKQLKPNISPLPYLFIRLHYNNLAVKIWQYLIEILFGADMIEQLPSGHQFQHEYDLPWRLVHLVQLDHVWVTCELQS